MDTDRQEHTFDGLKEGTNYSFTVNQTRFSGGGVLSFGTVYPRTFTAGKQHYDIGVQPNQYSKSRLGCFNHTVVNRLFAARQLPEPHCGNMTKTTL